MSIDDQSSVVNKTVVVDALKDIRVNITMAASNKHARLKLKLVLLSALLLLLMTFISLRFILFARVVFSSHASKVGLFIRMAPVLILILIFFFFIVDQVQLFEKKTLQVCIIKDFLRLIRIQTVIAKVVSFLVRLLLVFVSDDLFQHDLSIDGDSHLFEHGLDLHLDVLVFVGTWIDHGKVLLHELISLIVILKVALFIRNRQDNR